MTEKLLPCPLCDSDNARADNFIVEAAAKCLDCGLCITRQHSPSEDDGLPAVIKAWNTRADSAADVIRGLRDDMQAAIDDGVALIQPKALGGKRVVIIDMDVADRIKHAAKRANTWLSQHTETKEENVSG